MYSINKHQVEGQEFTVIEVKQTTIKVTFMDYGATILNIYTPDKFGLMENIVLEYNSLESYIENSIYLNAIIGPNSGRIKDAKYRIDNLEINLEKNSFSSDNLHSGSDCFAFKFFDYQVIDNELDTKVIFTYSKLEDDSIFPGNQEIKIVYTVTDSSLLIEFMGTTDKPALLNMTNHAYFNLSGNYKEEVLHHLLEVNSSNYMMLDQVNVPYKVVSSKNTILDFKKERLIKTSYLKDVHRLPTKGIDHPFIFDDQAFDKKQITLKDPISKRKMEMYTSYPCAVIYAHNFPNDKDLKFAVKQVEHLGICFETQNEPNGINIKGLNSSILKKDQLYYHKTLYRFGIYK